MNIFRNAHHLNVLQQLYLPPLFQTIISETINMIKNTRMPRTKKNILWYRTPFYIIISTDTKTDDCLRLNGGSRWQNEFSEFNTQMSSLRKGTGDISTKEWMNECTGKLMDSPGLGVANSIRLSLERNTKWSFKMVFSLDYTRKRICSTFSCLLIY